MLKKFLIFLLFVLIVVGAVLLYNVFQLKSKQIVVKETAEAITINPQAPENLSKAIQIPTITYDDATKKDTSAFRALHRLIAETFPYCDSLLEKKLISRFTLLYRWKGKDANLKPIILMAHQDVVPVEGIQKQFWKKYLKNHKQEKWKYPPFSGTIAENYIWGRGALDDKMSLFGLLEAAEFLLKNNFVPKQDIYFVFGHDEERGGSEGALKAAEYLKEKNISPEFVLDEGLFILQGLMPGIKKPIAFIGMAEKGYINIELSVLSQGGHSSRPPLETPVGILSRAIVALENQPFRAKIDGTTAQMFAYLAPEMPFGMKLILGNRWLFDPLLISMLSKSASSNSVLRTTIAPTMLQGSSKANVLPTKVTALINLRIKPGETIETVKKHIEKAIKDKRVKITVAGQTDDANNPVAPSDTASQGFKVLHKTIKQLFPDIFVAPALVPGGTDSKHFKLICDNIFRFGAMQLSESELAGFHGNNERISIANYQLLIRFYIQLLKNLNNL